jgi:hypothetical protein
VFYLEERTVKKNSVSKAQHFEDYRSIEPVLLGEGFQEGELLAFIGVQDHYYLSEHKLTGSLVLI